jgi:hypothetical protein
VVRMLHVSGSAQPKVTIHGVYQDATGEARKF